MDSFFDYFQISGLAFFLSIFAGRTLYLWIGKGINPIALGVGKKGIQRLAELSFIVALTAWIIEILLYALGTELRLFPAPLDMRFIDTIPAKLIGLAFVNTAFIIFIWALTSFRDSWRVGVDAKTQGALITTGIFALSRNPIFIFFDMYLIGTFLINGTLIFLLFAAFLVMGLHYQIMQEEKFLTKFYGQAYKDYCAGTGRYFGWRNRSHS